MPAQNLPQLERQIEDVGKKVPNPAKISGNQMDKPLSNKIANKQKFISWGKGVDHGNNYLRRYHNFLH